MAPPSLEGALFFKNTLHFHQKVSQKHRKIKIQSLELSLPGTTQMKLLIGGFEVEPLLAHWIQAMALLISKGTCVVPCVNPKHQGELQIKSEKD